MSSAGDPLVQWTRQKREKEDSRRSVCVQLRKIQTFVCECLAVWWKATHDLCLVIDEMAYCVYVCVCPPFTLSWAVSVNQKDLPFVRMRDTFSSPSSFNPVESELFSAHFTPRRVNGHIAGVRWCKWWCQDKWNIAPWATLLAQGRSLRQIHLESQADTGSKFQLLHHLPHDWTSIRIRVSLLSVCMCLVSVVSLFVC